MKLSLRIPLVLVALVALPLIALGYFAVDRGRSALEDREHARSEALTALKQGAIEDWLDDAVHQLQVFVSSPNNLVLLEETADGVVSKQAQSLSELMALVAGPPSPLLSAILIRASDGEVLVATEERQVGTFRDQDRHYIDGLQGPTVQGVYYSLRTRAPTLTAAVPVVSQNGDVIAVLAANLNLDRLSEILSRDQRMGETNETYLVDTSGFVVTQLRPSSAAPLTSVITTEGVTACLEGKGSYSGTYRDYRGVSVVGYSTWVPVLNVCMISEVDESEAVREADQLGKAVAFVGSGIALLSILIGLVFARSLVGPLERLRERAVRMSSGEEDVPLAAESNDEIGELAREFNLMAVAVAQRQAAMESLNRELEGARTTAEEANSAKSEFLSRMSHELRTPLNVVLGFAQVMKLDPLPPEHENATGHILASGRHLLNLIDEVLDLARIETNRLQLSMEPISVAVAITDATSLVQQLAQTRQITINAEPSSQDQYVIADRQRLRQVLLNLLSNAIKYNREGGQVTLSFALADAERCRISVTDTGPGIPLEKFDRIFDPFDRLGAERNGEIEGTGLGLALSKSLVEAMGGEVSVESSEGIGSTFSVELGLSPAQMEIEPRVDGADRTHASQLEDARAFVVLYIEDNLANVHLVEALIARRPNTQLLTAIQGSVGLDLAAERSPDLVILDLHLPDMSGETVLAKLRANPVTANIPIVIASADATEDTVQRLHDSGVTAFLTKPFDIKEFMAVIHRVSRLSRTFEPDLRSTKTHTEMYETS